MSLHSNSSKMLKNILQYEVIFHFSGRTYLNLNLCKSNVAVNRPRKKIMICWKKYPRKTGVFTNSSKLSYVCNSNGTTKDDEKL